ncbi:peptide deformylase [Corynebacterium caspium]|uniref:peptide deformylase n=1 Tax=Corynebacterium caspium TaxID=234828 RepID=UPI000364CB10|nr:peptide deformylase [Corynebacterium caspium]WKD58671.1 Peptide deformylase [Corynebacterium caspium DSM 44850]
MTVRPVVIYGDPVLHNATAPAAAPFSQYSELIDDMFETMKVANGVGLAANQIGESLRIFVYDCPDDTGTWHRGYVINPTLETSEVPKTMPADDGSDEEGCLSVPGESFPTGRAEWAKVTGFDLAGEPVEVEGTGFFARCLQHEVGHLDGYVYLDMLVGRYKRQAKRAIKDNGWDHAGNTWMPGVDNDPFGHGEPESEA